MKSKGFLLLLLLLFAETVSSQKFKIEDLFSARVFTSDSALYYFDHLPSFSIHKDNYMITGLNPTKPIDAENADARFQISFKQRITRSTLPFQTYMFITYTQATSWDIYKQSAPFRTTDYNPGLSIGKAIIKDGWMTSMAVFSIEHQSNGADGEQSRDMNWIGLYNQWFMSMHFSLETKAFIPFYLGKYTKDVFDYKGFFNVALNYTSPNKRFRASAEFHKTTMSALSGNFVAEAGYMLSDLYNIYLFGQYYNGYGENLLQYKDYTASVRVGICFKPDFFGFH